MSVRAPDPTQVRPVSRWLYLVLGFVCLGTGFVGLVTPGLPGFLFFLVALWAFARSSPRMETWMLEHPRIGPSLQSWKTDRSMSRQAKLAAILSIIAACSVSAYVFRDRFWLGSTIVLLGLFACLYLLNRPTRD